MDPQQEADRQRQREVQEVEHHRERGQVVRARGRAHVEKALQPRGGQAAEPDDPLHRYHVGDVDRLAKLVRVAPHELVGEEERDERYPVAQEQLAAAEQQGREPERDDHHVRGDGYPLGDHQDRKDHGVCSDGR